MTQHAFSPQAADPKAKSHGLGSLPKPLEAPDADKRLTPMQQRFVALVADKGLKPLEAAVKAGFKGQNIERQVRRLLAAPHIIDALTLESKRRLAAEAPRALHRMVHLSEGARSERVQMEATKDILDRAGLGQSLGTASGSVRLTINLLTPTADAVPSLQIEGSVVSDARDGEAPD